MRRIVAIVAISSALALAGCAATPAGVDGNLVNDWKALPAPTAVLPVEGDCYSSPAADMLENAPVACTTDHEVEVVHVGTFDSADAAKPNAPAAGTTAMKGAYGVCLGAAKKYLGADFHDGLMELNVVTPDANGWAGGQRWFRCDVNQVEALSDLELTGSTVSFKGILAKAGPLKLACVSWVDKGSYIDDWTLTACSKSHTGEYVGTYTAPNVAYTVKKFNALGDNGCWPLVARYLGISASSGSNTVGWAYSYTDEDAWANGDHYIRCYAAAFTHDKKFVGSVKGIGTRTAKG